MWPTGWLAMRLETGFDISFGYIYIYIYQYGIYIYISMVYIYMYMVIIYVYIRVLDNTTKYSTVQYNTIHIPHQSYTIEQNYTTLHCRTFRYVILHYTDMIRFNVSMVLTHAACRDDGIAASELAHVVESAAILSLAQYPLVI